ncbi:MAG: chemotaxis-specific protein-glutamate methyltransferase CheB [Candidatus Vecturithrix sp.]|jgi:two-component system response regulator WspF|nr:chemotaxis-specific protein-glutamate methyltransferase CheB [Candidatus Vecturithrix sp.]
MRIAIVNHRIVEQLRQLILSVPGYEIAWIARDGSDAVKKCVHDIPELILMEPNLPLLNGVEATRRIMRDSPCPILIVTDSVEGNAAKVFEAMGYGALDAVSAPFTGDDLLIQSSRMALLKKIKIIQRLRKTPSATTQPESVHTTQKDRQAPPMVAIGASAGGPRTLAKLLTYLPARLSAVITIIQHVDEEFSAGLVEWLNAQTSVKVRLAREGEQPKIGTAYVAGTNNHLILTPGLRFAYTPEPLHLPYRPSIDVFFESVARYWPLKGCAILLTGMGRDGAKGLALLSKAGWHTIAQDEATSIVYGMPKAAKELGAAAHILPIGEIGPMILKILHQ